MADGNVQVDEIKLRDAMVQDERLLESLQPKMSRYVPYEAKLKQKAFLMCDCREVLCGGDPGSGKTAMLLMSALQWVDVPGYAAIIFRRNLGDLTKPGGAKWLADQWLAPWVKKDILWDESNFQYKFLNPGGPSYVQFAHMQWEKDKYRMKGSAYQRICFDELTEFSFGCFTYAFRSLRPSSELKVPVPVGMRSTTNPGGEGEDWVVERYHIGAPEMERGRLNGKDKLYIEMDLTDGALNAEAYRQVLEEMEPIERERLLNQRWGLKDGGMMFKREDFVVVSDFAGATDRCRSWDLAASTKTSKHGHSADWTVGQLWAVTGAQDVCCLDEVRGRWEPGAGDSMIQSTAELDGEDVMIVLPQEPGQAGLRLRAHYEELLAGYPLTFYPQSASKKIRAHPYAYHAGKKKIYLMEGGWNAGFVDEHVCFSGRPSMSKDDRVDTASMAFRYLMGGSRKHVESMEVVSPWEEARGEHELERAPWDDEKEIRW